MSSTKKSQQTKNNTNTNTQQNEVEEVRKRPEFLDDLSKRKEVQIKDMKDLVIYLKEEMKDILKSHKQYINRDGITSHDFKEKQKKFLSDMNQLYNLFPTAIKNERRQKMKTSGRVGKGFLTPKCFNEDLINFIQTAKKEFGNYCYIDDSGKVIETKELLVDKLPYLQMGITATSLLTVFFHIYIKRNRKVMSIPEKGQFIKFTPLMREFFGKYREEMINSIAEKNKKKGKTDEEVSIDFDSFPLIRLQTLFSLLIDPNPKEEQLKALSDPQTRDAIATEQEFLSKTNEALKSQQMVNKQKSKKREPKSHEENEKSESIEKSEKEERTPARSSTKDAKKDDKREDEIEDQKKEAKERKEERREERKEERREERKEDQKREGKERKEDRKEERKEDRKEDRREERKEDRKEERKEDRRGGKRDERRESIEESTMEESSESKRKSKRQTIEKPERETQKKRALF
jgi:hypothetical protein